MGTHENQSRHADSKLYALNVEPLGVHTIEAIQLHDPLQGRDVTLRMHVPDSAGPFPLIVFSHGSLCSPKAYDPLTLFWASRGYAVIVPHHLDSMDNPPSAGPPDLGLLLSSRIRDLSFVLDALPGIAAQADAKERIDSNRIAAAGHSFGALTALVKTGLPLQPGAYQLDGDTADDRFMAAINMSGVGPLPPLAEDAFSHLACPLLVTGGTLDEGNVGTGPVLSWEWRMSAYTLAPAGDKYSVVLERGDHYLGGLIARHDRGGSADPEGLQILSAVSTAFLDAYVRRSDSALDWLQTADLAGLTNSRAVYERK